MVKSDKLSSHHHHHHDHHHHKKRGPTGPTGPTGPVGKNGKNGPTGARGSTGPTGTIVTNSYSSTTLNWYDGVDTYSSDVRYSKINNTITVSVDLTNVGGSNTVDYFLFSDAVPSTYRPLTDRKFIYSYYAAAGTDPNAAALGFLRSDGVFRLYVDGAGNLLSRDDSVTTTLDITFNV